MASLPPNCKLEMDALRRLSGGNLFSGAQPVRLTTSPGTLSLLFPVYCSWHHRPLLSTKGSIFPIMRLHHS